MNSKVLIICLNLLTFQLNAQVTQNNIRLNQAGFYPFAQKIAVVVGDTKPREFYIISARQNKIVYKGTLGEIMQSANSSLKTRLANFSSFTKPGSYRVQVPGTGESYTFSIAARVHAEVAKAALKGFYYQRVSMPLESAYAGKWSRPAGHPDTSVLIHPSAASTERPAGTRIASPGGWYDAGDYNKYIVNSGITMGTLLSAYEDFKTYFDTLHINIPESKDNIPDILNECIYNLRWMLTMQDPTDGGVYHKCTNAAFDGMVMPGVTKAPRYVVQKGTAATLDFAAVMAQASRIFARYNRQLPGLADSCLAAAVHAYAWAEKNPSLVYDQNAINRQYEPKISTGAYGDTDLRDEWLWAAAELFVTTRQHGYLQMVNAHINEFVSLASWANVRLLGFYCLLRSQKELPSESAPVIEEVKRKIMLFVKYLDTAKQNAFKTIIGVTTRDFVWGSNAVAANQSIVLINAYFITGQKYYLQQALLNLDYIMGRNATGYCFVTGIGERSPLHPHHRPSVADGITEPVPGLLVGGPTPGKQDNCVYAFSEPETTYADIDCSYTTNEIAINWNAALVYLANAMEALQAKAGYVK